MQKPVAKFWYAVQPQAPGILRINEAEVDPYSVGDIWFLRGKQQNLVIDTGSGMVPPAPLIESFSDKPVLAVALNSYYDHAGGWHSFTERACHSLDAAALADPVAENASYSTYLKDESLRALPRAGYSTADYRMSGAEATRLLEDGEMIDLGDRCLEVLHVPGRSPGGLALWEEATGSLFTSDMLYDGDHGEAWPPRDRRSFTESLARMRRLPVTRVFPGHYGAFDGARMRAVIDRQLASLGGGG